jgi:putative ABC transport system permease protein
VLGRVFGPGDFRANGEAEAVTVLSFKLWHRLFNADPAVAGRMLVVNDKPHVILGVMPPRFGWYTNDGLWLPLTTLNPQTRVAPIVRLKPGVTQTVAEQQLLTRFRELATEAPNRFPKDGITATFSNYLDVTVSSGQMRSSLVLLFYAVGFLLLIACTNVANLQLARAAARGREIAVRLAVGASRGRVVRQLLTESVTLALLGGVVGVFIAYGLTQIIVALMPNFYVPNEARVTMNGWVLGFSVVISVLTGVLFGLAPGLAATRPDLTEALKDGGHAGGTGSVRGARVRSVLVVSEVALSIVLLVGACLAIRGFVTMQMTDRGFQSERMLVIRVPLDAKRYPTFEQRNGFARDLLERLQRLPGVTGVTVGAPPQFDSSSGGQVPGQAKVENGIGVNFASEDYLRTLAIPLRRGRTFTADEIARGERVALVNEAAMKLWPTGESPIDRTIQIDSLVGGGGNNLPAPNATKEVRVIGIVGDVRTRDPLRAAGPVVIVPYTLRAPTNRNFLIKTQGEPTSVVNLVRSELRAMDRELPLLQPFTVEEVMNSQTAQPRFNMALFTALAAIALLLAAAGIYSVLSYHVAQRTREIGVRVALGASRSDILRLVMTAGGRLVGIGLVLGAAMSIVLAKIITTQVFAVPLFDPLAMIAAVVLLSLAGMFACAVPGRRATKVHPMVALRTD